MTHSLDLARLAKHSMLLITWVALVCALAAAGGGIVYQFRNQTVYGMTTRTFPLPLSTLRSAPPGVSKIVATRVTPHVYHHGPGDVFLVAGLIGLVFVAGFAGVTALTVAAWEDW